MNKKVEIIIISYNCRDLTSNCIESLYSSSDPGIFGITVVDNASMDGTPEFVSARFPQVKLIRNGRNLGYGTAANIGARTTGTPYIIISNADIIYHNNTVESMVKYLDQNPSVAVVGPQQVFPDGRWQYSWGDYPGIGAGIKEFLFIHLLRNFIRKIFWKTYKLDRSPKEPGYLDGAVLCFRKNLFDSVGGFDEDFFFYSEEADLCYRLKKAGFGVVFNPDIMLTHYRGSVAAPSGFNENNAHMMISSNLLFCKKHRSRFESRIYAGLLIAHLRFLVMSLGIVQKILPGKSGSYLAKKKDVFSLLLRTWKTESKNYINK